MLLIKVYPCVYVQINHFLLTRPVFMFQISIGVCEVSPNVLHKLFHRFHHGSCYWSLLDYKHTKLYVGDCPLGMGGRWG